jgi:hypothetical protein
LDVDRLAVGAAVRLAAAEIILKSLTWEGLRPFRLEICRLGYYYTHGYCLNPASSFLFGVPGFLFGKPFPYYSLSRNKN